MLSQQKQTQQASFQSSQQAFSQLQQQLQMPQTSNCATAPSWFETESTVMAGVEGFQQNYIDNSDDSFWIESPIFQETSSSNQTMETPSCFDYQLDEIHGFEQARQIPLSFHQYGIGLNSLPLKMIQTILIVLLLHLGLKLKVQPRQESRDFSRTILITVMILFGLSRPYFKRHHLLIKPWKHLASLTIKLMRCTDLSRLDKVHCSLISVSAAENDPFSTRVEWTENQICTSTNGLDTGLELPPTQPSPRSSCFSDTSLTLGEEDELAVLLQQLQQTAPTLDSFNPDFGLTDALGFPSNVTVQ